LNSKYALLRNQEWLLVKQMLIIATTCCNSSTKKSTAEKIEQVVAINSIDDLNLVADSTASRQQIE
jgi:hypothetical protein